MPIARDLLPHYDAITLAPNGPIPAGGALIGCAYSAYLVAVVRTQGQR